jgi:NarL family two-component system sensor histidine kinase LiaS
VFRLSLEDNGHGFAVGEARAAGNGLSNMRSRLEKIGGRFELESHSGRGTIIRLSVPLHPRVAAGSGTA